MKNFRRTSTVNRFSAISTSFRSEFTRRLLPKPKIHMTLSTILSDESKAAEMDWLESLLEIWHQGAMVFDASMDIVQATEFTEKMLEKYFIRAKKDSSGTPLELMNWMSVHHFNSNNGVEMTAEPFVIEEGEDELTIRLIVDNRARRKTLLLKETTKVKPESLIALGLTKRESEVLFLIAKGKTNPEIGMLLDISTRTVQKHVEHIYIKLGVETRTAAMLRVNEIASDIIPDRIPFAEIS